MSSQQELTQEQQDVVARVEKLLRLAARNTNAEEAASANAKAQELLVAYNLQAVDVSGDEEKSARREQAKIKGGMFTYQRELWRAIAELNFCLYYNMEHAVQREYRKKGGWVDRYWGKEFRHHVIGRVVNVAATRAMGSYLEQTIERLVRERYPLGSQRFMREAVAYREGIAEEIELRLYERRQHQEAERRRSEAQRMRDATSTSNALTIADYAQSERDANMDEIMGEGYSARKRDERRQRAEARRAAEEEYTRWAEANPEEARKEEAKRQKEERRRSSRRSGGRRAGPTARDRRSWTSEYAQGRDRGREVSLDQQADDRKSTQRRLT